MDATDVLETVDAAEWGGPFDAATQARTVAALESGRVIVLPMGFAFTSEEAPFLTAEGLDNSRKNISLDPRTGQCQGSGYDGAQLLLMSGLLGRYADRTRALLDSLLPGYTAQLDQARTSFRPAEISGRDYSPRHDDRRLHVDAFPTRPMRGRRILRVFTNVAPDGAERHWRVGEPFAAFAAKFARRSRAALPGQFWAMDTLGLTKGRRSAYDHMMLGLHDRAKLDAGYQQAAPRAEVAFAPGTTWMCFTDSVLHAAMSGHCALEQTFHIPVEAMADPGKSPLRILERLTGHALV